VGTVAIVVGIVLLCACLLLGWFAVRRVRLMRGGGVDLCLRRRPASFDGRDDVAGWHFGVGRYHGDEFRRHPADQLGQHRRPRHAMRDHFAQAGEQAARRAHPAAAGALEASAATA